MNKILLYPPVTFLIILFFSLLLSKLFSRLSYRGQDKQAKGTTQSYACGENVENNLAQPDYSEFFPFAFFFTIAHVATLMLTTASVETIEAMVLAFLYIAVVIVGLVVLLKEKM